MGDRAAASSRPCRRSGRPLVTQRGGPWSWRPIRPVGRYSLAAPSGRALWLPGRAGASSQTLVRSARLMHDCATARLAWASARAGGAEAGERDAPQQHVPVTHLGQLGAALDRLVRTQTHAASRNTKRSQHGNGGQDASQVESRARYLLLSRIDSGRSLSSSAPAGGVYSECKASTSPCGCSLLRDHERDCTCARAMGAGHDWLRR